MKKVVALLIFLTPLGLATLAQAANVYTGFLGKAPITVLLPDAQGDNTSPTQAYHGDGSYFYQKYQKSILLTPDDDCPAQKRCFSEVKSDWDTPDITWILDAPSKPSSSVSGTWQQANKTLSISLKIISPPHDANATQTYLKQLYGQATFKPDQKSTKPSRFMGKTLKWHTNKKTELSYFTITSGYDSATRKQLNELLEANAWQALSSIDDCMAATASSRSDMFVTITPRFLGDGILSVSYFSSYYCGGAHPDFGDTPLNYDIATQRGLSLEDIIWVNDTSPAQTFKSAYNYSASDWDAFQSYRETHLAPWLYRTLSILYPAHMQERYDGDRVYHEYDFIFPIWYISEQGLYISPSMSRAERAYEYPEWSHIPFNLAKKHRGASALDFK